MLKNLPSKIFALLLGIIIWGAIVSNIEKVHTFKDPIQVEFFNVPADLIVSLPENPMTTFVIKGEDANVSSLTAASFNAYIDLKEAKEGKLTLPILSSVTSPNLSIVRTEPAELEITLEKKGVKMVPVVIQTEGQVDQNFTFEVQEPETEEIEIKGPASVVEEISEALALVKFRGDETVDLKRSIKLLARDGDGNTKKTIELNPETIALDISLKQTSNSKTVGTKITLDNNDKLAPGYWIKSTSVNPSSVTIRGSSDRLKRIQFVSTEPIDAEGLSTNIYKSVALKLPSGIELAGGASKWVSVEIKVDVEKSKRTIFKEVSADNVEEGLVLESIEPATIKFIVEGDLESINTIQEKDISVYLDFSSRGAGTHQMGIEPGDISLESVLSLVDYEPKEVTAKLIEATIEEEPKEPEEETEEDVEN